MKAVTEKKKGDWLKKERCKQRMEEKFKIEEMKKIEKKRGIIVNRANRV